MTIEAFSKFAHQDRVGHLCDVRQRRPLPRTRRRKRLSSTKPCCRTPWHLLPVLDLYTAEERLSCHDLHALLVMWSFDRTSGVSNVSIRSFGAEKPGYLTEWNNVISKTIELINHLLIVIFTIIKLIMI